MLTWLATIIEYIEAVGYEVNVKVMDTKDYGLPQRRKRLYVCGVLKKFKNHTF